MSSQFILLYCRLVTNLPGGKFMKWLLLLTLLCSQSLFASQLSGLSFLYYKDQIKSTQEKHFDNPGHCSPNSTSCMKAACTKLPRRECDDDSEIKRVIEMCRGNVNGDCVQNATRRLETSDIDDLHEMEKIAIECRSNLGGTCIALYINNLSENDVDDDYEVIKFIKKCSGVSNEVADCAAFTCSRLSASSCDDDYEIDRVLKSCGN